MWTLRHKGQNKIKHLLDLQNPRNLLCAPSHEWPETSPSAFILKVSASSTTQGQLWEGSSKGLGKHGTTEGSRRGSRCQRHRPRAGSKNHAERSLQAPATKKQWAGDLGAVWGHREESTRHSAVELILQSGCWLPNDLGKPKALSTFWKQRSWYWWKILHGCSRTEIIVDFQKPNSVLAHKPLCAAQFWFTSRHLPRTIAFRGQAGRGGWKLGKSLEEKPVSLLSDGRNLPSSGKPSMSLPFVKTFLLSRKKPTSAVYHDLKHLKYSTYTQ